MRQLNFQDLTPFGTINADLTPFGTINADDRIWHDYRETPFGTISAVVVVLAVRRVA